MFKTDSPSLSQEGDEVVFSTPATGHGDIYLAGVRTGTARRLTTSEDFESSPYFIPNSRLIVFEREDASGRNVWTVDLQSGEERQLINGSFNDAIVDIAATGKHVLVSRSDRKRGGTSIVLADLQTRVAIEMSDSYQAKFIAGGKSLLITEGVETPSVFEMNLNGEVVSRLADGTVTDVCDEANAAIVLGQRPAKSPDDELFFLDLQTKELERIGSGARAVVFPNGKVLFTVGYECKAMIWQKDQGKPRAIDSPPGYNVGPNRSPGATVASFYIMPPSSPDRLYNIYLFDSDTELFSKVIVTLPSE